MTSTWIVTLEDDGLTALKAIESAVLTEVQSDVVPNLIAFLENAASDTITYLGGFLNKVVNDIKGSNNTNSATDAPTSPPPAV